MPGIGSLGTSRLNNPSLNEVNNNHQSQPILISALGIVHEEPALERRLMLLPVIWGAFGIGEALSLQYLLSPIAPSLPVTSNDKPISGSLLPFLFLSTAMFLIELGLSLYSIGYLKPNFKTKNNMIVLTALPICRITGHIIIYTPL